MFSVLLPDHGAFPLVDLLVTLASNNVVVILVVVLYGLEYGVFVCVSVCG